LRIEEGDGWRLAIDPARAPFDVLIGGAGWAAELTRAEAALLRRGVLRLVEQHAELVDGMMAEESLTLEFEAVLADDPAGPAGELWLELEGNRRDWSLRFVLTAGPRSRGVEGSWGPAASRSLAAVLHQQAELAESP
jgi:hypothetical protein